MDEFSLSQRMTAEFLGRFGWFWVAVVVLCWLRPFPKSASAYLVSHSLLVFRC